MGWLRLAGSLKLWVSFAKWPYKRDDILHKRSITLRSLLIAATSYIAFMSVLMSEKVYGVATISRLLKITGFFCKRALQKRSHSA